MRTSQHAKVGRFFDTPAAGAFLGKAAFAVLKISGAGLTVFLAFVVAFAQTGPQELDDPILVDRKLVAPEQLEAEIGKMKSGVLRRLTRKAFEEQMQKAARRLKKRTTPPRLLRARYWAELDGDCLTGGGDWKLQHAASAPAILPLPDLQLALKNVRMQNQRPAVLGMLQKETPGLLVEQKGFPEVYFDWSLGSSTTPGELHFDFQVPACPTSTLELKLPKEYVVSVFASSGILLSGPRSADRENLRIWQLSFSGKSKISFFLYRTTGPAAIQPLHAVKVETQQKLFPDQQLAEYKFDIKVFHNVTDKLIFDWDPPLQPIKVQYRGRIVLKDWSIKKLSLPDEHSKKRIEKNFLVVQFPQPVRDDLPPLTITCQAPLPDDGRWKSPRMWLRNSILRKETLNLYVHPDVALQNWRNGAFRLMQLSKETDSTKNLSLGTKNLLLINTAADAERPSALLQRQQTILSTRQDNWWQVGEQGSTLLSNFHFRVQQGKCHFLQIQLPKDWKKSKGKGWQIESLDFSPRENLRGSVTYLDRGRWILHLDLKQGLTTNEQAELSLQLRSPPQAKVPAKGTIRNFPEVSPRAHGPLKGSLGISVDSLFRALTIGTSQSPTPPPHQPPWEDVLPQFYFDYRQQPVQGKLQLIPQQAQFRARWYSEVIVRHKRSTLLTTMDLEPIRGGLPFVDVYFSAPLLGKLMTEPRKSSAKLPVLRRLPNKEKANSLLLLGAATPLQLAVTAAAVPRGQWWRIHFAKPIKTQTTIHLRASSSTRAQFEAHRNTPEYSEIPLPVIFGAVQSEGTVVLNGFGVQIEEKVFEQLANKKDSNTENAIIEPQRTPRPASPEKLFYSAKKGQQPLPRLWLRTRPIPSTQPLRERCDYAALTTVVRSHEELLHHFLFDVKNWKQPTLALKLPTPVKIVCARVQGRWTQELIQKEMEDHILVSLPSDPAADHQRFELVYVSGEVPSRWYLTSQLHSPLPQLPVPPLHLKRTWRLEPDLTPLDSKSLLQILPAQQEKMNSLAETLESVWTAGQSWTNWMSRPRMASPSTNPVYHTLLETEQEFRKKGGNQSWLLSDALRSMLRKDHAAVPPLLMDTFALQAAAVFPDASVFVEDLSAHQTERYQPFWEKCGLVLVPLKNAGLLTTKQQLGLWREAGISPAAKGLEQAAREAVLYGTDANGRFQTVLVWSTPSSAAGESAHARLPLLRLLLTSQESGWTEWQPLPGRAHPDNLLITHTPSLRILGWLLAVIVAFLSCVVSRRVNLHWCLRIFLFLLLGSLVLLLWLPPSLQPIVWPPILVAAVIFIWTFLRRQKPAHSTANDKRTRQVLMNGSALLMLGFCLCLAAFAQTPETQPYTVLILGTPATKYEEQKVLAPIKLLEKLKAMASKPDLELPDVVLVEASYKKGKLKGDMAVFRAELQCYCFADDVTLLLPFKGIRLQKGALLEGAPIYPIPAPGNAGYLVSIRGRKGHFVTLQIPFEVFINNGKIVRSLKFSIPRLLQNELTLDFPKDCASIQAVTSRGCQRTYKKDNGICLETDLGMANLGSKESKVHIRWYQVPAKKSASVVDVSEQHLLNLQPISSKLTSVFRYRIKKGSLRALRIRLPQNVHVRSVEVSRPFSAKVPAVGVRLKNWHIQRLGKNRELRAQLQFPVGEEILLSLGLICPTPVNRGFTTVMLPAPVGTGNREGVLAFMSEDGTFLDKAPDVSYSTMPRKDFRQQWQELGMVRPEEPIHSFRFKRKHKRNQPDNLVKLYFASVASPWTAQQQIHWFLHPNHADVRATLKVNSAKEDIMLLEWQVPAELAVSDIRCPNLLDWTSFVTGNNQHLKIWLDKPQRSAEIELQGWMLARGPHSGRSTWLPPRGKRVGQFHVPVLVCPSAQSSSTRIQIEAHKGLKLKPLRAKNAKRDTKAKPLSYVTERKNYFVTIQAQRSAVKPEIHTLLLCEVGDTDGRFIAYVHYRMPVGPLKSASLSVENPDGRKLYLDAPGAGKITRKQKGKRTTWTVQLPPNITQDYTLKVSCRLAFSGKKPLSLPRLHVEGGDEQQRFFALVGQYLEVVDKNDLVSREELPPRYAQWLSQGERIWRQGKIWQVQSPKNRLQIRRTPSAFLPAVRVLSAEQILTWAEDGRWIHEGFYTFTATKGQPLRISLPARARVLSILLNGKAVLARQTAPGSLQITLPDNSSLNNLILRWSFPEDADTLNRPILTPVQFETSSPHEQMWTVHVPAGCRLSQAVARSDELVRTNPTEADLHHIEALLQITAFLAETRQQKPSTKLDRKLESVQKAFYWYCSQVDTRIRAMSFENFRSFGKLRKLENAPALEQRHSQWLAKLRTQNKDLAEKHDFETVRTAAQNQPALTGFWQTLARPGLFQGYGHSWYASRKMNPPVLQLAWKSGQQLQQRMWLTELLLGVLVLSWIVCSIPGMVTLLRWTWPEQLLALALVGISAFGMSLVGVLLLAVAAGSRLVLVSLGVRQLWRRWFSRATASGAS